MVKTAGEANFSILAARVNIEAGKLGNEDVLGYKACLIWRVGK